MRMNNILKDIEYTTSFHHNKHRTQHHTLYRECVLRQIRIQLDKMLGAKTLERVSSRLRGSTILWEF